MLKDLKLKKIICSILTAKENGSVIYQVCICKLLCSINSPELIP